MNVIRSVGLFVAAGLAEIGGGYLVWRWLRDGAPWPVGLAGAVILVIYGVIPTLQSADDFGRIYAAYGGVFVIMSLLWGWAIDGHHPDNYDWLGAAIVAVGVAVIFFSPHRLFFSSSERARCLRPPPARRPEAKASNPTLLVYRANLLVTLDV
jgi:small multidrug resistance family-3 protein